MCFPSKWLKKNFVEEETPTASGSKSAREAGKSASEPITNNGTVAAKESSAKAFKTAIVIYSMYGHIASRESEFPLGGPSINFLMVIYSFSPISCRVR